MKIIRRTVYALAFVLTGTLISQSAARDYVLVSTNALSFDGTNGFVQIGGADLPPPWTATMWVQREAAFGASAALLFSPAGALKLEQWPDTHQVGFTQFGVADYYFNYIAPEGVWTHLAFVATPSNTTLYVNGVAQDVINASIPLPLQSLASPTVDPLKGQVDEVTVWRTARNAGQVRANYQTRARGNEPGLELLWHLDETNGPTARDFSSRHHTGTLSNGVSRVISEAQLRIPRVVSNASDSGPGSLRQTILDSSYDEVIRFAPSLSGKTIKLTSGPLIVDRSLILDGSTLARPVVISGNHTSRVFTVTASTSSLLYKLKIVDGFDQNVGGGLANSGDLAVFECTFSGSYAGGGGAIFNQAGATLTLDRCVVTRNSAYYGGGIRNHGQLVASDSVISANTSTSLGGGLSLNYNLFVILDAAGPAKAEDSARAPAGEPAPPPASVTLFRCTVSGNTGEFAGGISNGEESALTIRQCTISSNLTRDSVFNLQDAGNGGGINNSGTLLIERSLLSGNRTGRGADGGTGGSGGSGGALINYGQTTINDSTFSGNSTGGGGLGSDAAGFGGQGGHGGAIRNEGSLVVNNSTLTGNSTGDGGTSGKGGAIYAGAGPMTLNHTTISDNRNGSGFTNLASGGIWSVYPVPDLNGAHADPVRNVVGPPALNSCIVAGNWTPSGNVDLFGGFYSDHSLVNVEALLAPLGLYGGPTPTMPPLPGSPAIDAGGDTGFDQDQRGFGRPVGAARDIGAVEVQDNPVATKPTIVVSPKGLKVATGSTQTLRAGVTGTAPFRYQWQFNGRSIPGGTNAMLVLSNIQRVTGGSYKVRVSNDFGSATSKPARLKVVQPVTITAQPQGVTADPGTRVVLGVSATGGTPLRYQWRLFGTNVPGATRSSLTIPALDGNKVGPYRVLVSNPVGSAYSDMVTVSLTPP